VYKTKRLAAEEITPEREINILKHLGLEPYEINYLLFMKQREEASAE
jgi:hypothetical protein